MVKLIEIHHIFKQKKMKYIDYIMMNQSLDWITWDGVEGDRVEEAMEN